MNNIINKKVNNPSQKVCSTAIQSMKISSYPGKVVRANRDRWLVHALRNNPGIIECIRTANETCLSVESVTKDSCNAIATGLVTVDINNFNDCGTKALAYVCHKICEVDIDFQVSKDVSFCSNWQGASKLWVHVAVSHAKGSIAWRFAFQEHDGRENSAGSAALKSWRPRIGTRVLLCSDDCEEKSITVDRDHMVALEATFSGWVIFDLNESDFEIYWSSSACSSHMDLTYVDQFQMCVNKGLDNEEVTVCFDAFGVSGEVKSTTPPPQNLQICSPADKYLNVWSLQYIVSKDAKISKRPAILHYDEFPGKLLTGMAYEYILASSAKLKNAGDCLVKELANVQQKDGYLGIYPYAKRFGGDGSNWDVWGHYHAVYGLYMWYSVTGSPLALEVAIKTLDCVWNHFAGHGRSFLDAGSPTMNLSISHVFALLYLEIGDERYLKAAKEIVDKEWLQAGNWMCDILRGKAFYQLSLPRWEALHTILTLGTLYRITNEANYYSALELIWESIAKTDRHNTGGFSTWEQAVGTPYKEGAIETCCTIAWMALSTEYLQLSCRSVVADELELCYYNAMLGSVLPDHKTATYNTAMNGPHRVASQIDVAFQYYPTSPDFNCCQANVGRGLGELSQWAAMQRSGAWYLNDYMCGQIDGISPSGQPMQIIKRSNYPLSGDIDVHLVLEKPEKFSFCCRIPSWTTSATVSVNDEASHSAKPGTYDLIDRIWETGDVIHIHFPMMLHVWRGENECAGKCSLYYGPILLCAEGQEAEKMCEQNNIIQMADLNCLQVTFADDTEHWLQFTLKMPDVTVTMHDFATSGMRNAYETWFPVRVEVEPLQSDILIWCQQLCSNSK